MVTLYLFRWKVKMNVTPLWAVGLRQLNQEGQLVSCSSRRDELSIYQACGSLSWKCPL